MRWYGRLPRLVRDEAAVVTRLLEILRADKTLRRTPH
jgi:hypothetical protein